MYLQATIYHSLLRVSAVVFALVLLFDSGFISPLTKEMSDSTQDYLANVTSVTASVEPTELNQITAELTKQKLALETREQELVEREVQIARNAETADTDRSTFILSIILFILLALILLNYGLDFARMRRMHNQPANA